MITQPCGDVSGGPAVAGALADLVVGRVAPAARAWFESVRAAVTSRASFAEVFALTARKVGKAPLSPSAEESATLRAAGVTWPVGHFGLDEAARVTLLVAAAGHLSRDDFMALVDDAWRAADNRERQAVLKSLPLLPEPERFLDLAVDACRTSIEPIFEAIACENPYPHAHFPELNWNQMVLKAVFIGVALERILGLAERVTPELTRMARDYASERRAAGRPVPDDLLRLSQEAHP